MENYEKNFPDQKIEHWVMDKAERWRDHYNNNYKEKFDEYYRIWRGHGLLRIRPENQSVLVLFLQHSNRQSRAR